MKKTILFSLLTISFSILIGCSVVDDIQDSLDAVECANLFAELNDDIDNDESCSSIMADIDRILSSCNEFITSEQREVLEFVRTNCQDN